jgi:hypothetical protein
MHISRKGAALCAAVSAAVAIALARAGRDGEPGSGGTTAEPTASVQPAAATALGQAADTLEPTTPETLIRRSSDTFIAGYFTFIAIIQGVALALLAQQAVADFSGRGTTSRLLLLGEVSAALTAIIVVSYEYLWLTTVMRWAPTFVDTLAPFLLGAAEIVACLLVGERVWWIAVACFFGAAAAVLLHTVHQCTDALFDGRKHLNILIRRVLYLQIRWCIIGAGAAAVMSAIVFTVKYVALPAAFSWAAILIGVEAVLISERGLDTLYRDYGVPRRRRGR